MVYINVFLVSTHCKRIVSNDRYKDTFSKQAILIYYKRTSTGGTIKEVDEQESHSDGLGSERMLFLTSLEVNIMISDNIPES
jgi:hypothetical protein